MILRNPPQHFVPAWLPRMRERNERATAIRLAQMRRDAQSRAQDFYSVRQPNHLWTAA